MTEEYYELFKDKSLEELKELEQNNDFADKWTETNYIISSVLTKLIKEKTNETD